jgi:hypothetical protein
MRSPIACRSLGKSSGFGDVRFVHRRLFHLFRELRGHRVLLLADVGKESRVGKPGGDENETADFLRVLRRELQRDAAAERVSEDVDLFETGLLEHGAHVLADRDEVDLARAERGATVTVEIDGDDGPMVGERGHDGREHVRRPESAVQQQQGLARAADLVVILEAVRLDVAGFFRGRGGRE